MSRDMAVASGDLARVRGRYTGWRPKPLVAVDIFRVEEGKVAEHWGVMQEEVPASQAASGNPMFNLPRSSRAIPSRHQTTALMCTHGKPAGTNR